MGPPVRFSFILHLTTLWAAKNRDGIGARVLPGNQANQVTSAVGYASSSHRGVHFGLGKTEDIETVTIQWPSGPIQNLATVEANQVIEVREPD